jgi:hypothetical protein
VSNARPMTARELARIVRDMRNLQTACEAGQSHLLASATAAEKRVDDACYSILTGQAAFDFGGEEL